MRLEWKSYNVDLELFNEWLRDNQPKTDGLVATEEELTVIEIESLNESEKTTIESYYNQLPEYVKGYTQEELQEAILNKKQEILNKDITTLTQVEKKILLNIELTEQEKYDLVNE